MPARSTPKVLHVVSVLDRWSVETWLLRMLAHARARGEALDWTFYCADGHTGSRDDEARALGARVIHSPAPIGDKLAFTQALRAELARGRYNVLHCHHDLVSGVYLAASVGLPIGARLAHVHNLDESVLTPSALKQAVLRPTLRRTCFRLADKIIANSEHTLDAFLAGRRRDPARHLVHHLGLDPGPFARAKPDRAAFRRDLGLPIDAPILLFAGRMTPEKNPTFAVDVLAALRRRVPAAVAVFAGDGGLVEPVWRRAEALGSAGAVRLLGWRDDIAEIMSASDWFILPHPHQPMEGFGIAVVEAQLAGLRLLLSQGVSDAPILPGAAWRRLSLDDGPQAWAKAAADLWAAGPPSRDEALAAFCASPMDLDHALADLMRLHGLPAGSRAA
ncbi:MAG TPA: glycosyltransferase [Caulobacteraceae bacterium]|jgi:glycosyltransferase involved in cell wall biosynthesis|nr:glycosyltransferase [Caulobacteraceae bacterium]